MSISPTYSFTTGVATLPDVGKLSYNGCTFSPLFTSTVSGSAVKDEARRTIIYMEYTITVDGYVTLQDDEPVVNSSTNPVMNDLRRLLTAQGGHLIYEGRGCDIVVNGAGGGVKDVAWGPIPELLEFQPLGGGQAAKVQWRVTTRIPEIKAGSGSDPSGGITLQKVDGLAGGMLQFNYESSVSFGEDGYSNITVRGILEIPLTRTPNQKTRTLTQTADNLRTQIDARVMRGIDLGRFRVTRRNFNLSRDKRTLVWDIGAEEKAYMDLPRDCIVARGAYSVRPAKTGMGLCNWLCTLRATYTVRRDMPRRTAWLAFLALLRHRMAQAANAPKFEVVSPQNPNPGTLSALVPYTLPAAPLGVPGILFFRSLLKTQNATVMSNKTNKALLLDFNIDEGLYLDSKTVTFSATWRLVSQFTHILLASGVWTKVPETDAARKNIWAISMKDVQGSRSWLTNRADPNLDVIVDFGS